MAFIYRLSTNLTDVKPLENLYAAVPLHIFWLMLMKYQFLLNVCILLYKSRIH